METRVVKIDIKNIDTEAIEDAGRIIRDGGLVAFPTETVYGLGGDAFNPKSSQKIYAAKGRPSDNPLIVHIADLSDLGKVAKDIPDAVYKVAKAFWPGPLTMILKKVDNLPKETTGGLDTVAVRMPVHPVALDFIRAAGGFVAAPSANLSGKPSPTSSKYVIEDMFGRIEMIIDGGDSDIGLESTIIDMTSEEPMILRPGFITQDDLLRVLLTVNIDETIMSDTSGKAPKAPGMKYRHYAPKGDLTIIDGETKKVIDYINQKVLTARADNIRTGVISTDETYSFYEADAVKTIGSRNDEASIAKNLFRILREFDDEDIDLIFAESFSNTGISMATMNRLLKAAGHKEVKL
ncbi:MAG: threonylcarbamoyl-AMP synthase [Lachnospiraceae bacterium]|nr:threonylcarbamoyl-AMP synthase [Lachnospiraceae bacterium]